MNVPVPQGVQWLQQALVDQVVQLVLAVHWAPVLPEDPDHPVPPGEPDLLGGLVVPSDPAREDNTGIFKYTCVIVILQVFQDFQLLQDHLPDLLDPVRYIVTWFDCSNVIKNTTHLFSLRARVTRWSSFTLCTL